GLRRRVPAVQAGLVLAAAADVGVDRGDLRGRGAGEREVEVAQRAHPAAERARGEEDVYRQRGSEVAEGQPRREPRARPQVEDLVGEEERQQQHHDEPLVAERAGPRELAWQQPLQAAGEAAREHQGARRAERVAQDGDAEHEEAAVVQPHGRRRDVARPHLAAGEAVDDDEQRQQQQRELQGEARVAPASEAPEAGQRQQVEPARLVDEAGRPVAPPVGPDADDRRAHRATVRNDSVITLRPSWVSTSTVRIQSPGIENPKPSARYRPGSTSAADAMTGTMPACVMSPCTSTVAPDTASPPSRTRTVTTPPPTRGSVTSTAAVSPVADAPPAEAPAAPPPGLQAARARSARTRAR